jgi:ubiquinone/menaquinone biosynthesis C-methylase UbiE
MDFGCGAGCYTIELARRASRVVAVDLQTEMLKMAQRKANGAGADNTIFLQSNETRIELEDRSVDLILLVTVFQEISGQAIVQRELHRILKAEVD